MKPSGRMMKPEPSPRVGCCCGACGKPRKNGANGLFGPKGLALLPPPLSSSSSPSSPGEVFDTGTLLTTVMLTTAGPYFCTMVLKSGNTAAGLPVAGTEVTGPVAVAAGAVTAAAVLGVTPKAYRTLTGAAMTAAPSAAAASGFRIRVLTLICLLSNLYGSQGVHDMRCSVGSQT